MNMFRFAIRVTHSSGQSVEHVFARNTFEAQRSVKKMMAVRGFDGCTIGPIKSKPVRAYKEAVR